MTTRQSFYHARGKIDLPLLISIAGAGAIAILLGVYLGMHRHFPYQWVKDSETALQALTDSSLHLSSRVLTDLWGPAWTEQRGVTVHDPDKVYQGYTLYTSGHAQKAFLIDMDGNTVHEWSLPFSKVDLEGIHSDAKPENTYFRDVYLYPNGDLLAIYVAYGITPWGMGMVKIDRDSNLIWKFLEPCHHDISVGEDGRIYALTHRITNQLPKAFDQVVTPVINDAVVVLSADGKKLDELPILQALADSDLQGFIEEINEKRRFAKGDILHTNTIEVLPQAIADRFPFARAGQVVVSFRGRHVIATLDLETRKMSWARRGPWVRQHDPDFLPDGHMLLFDNQGWLGEGGRSRVLEFDPVTDEIVWQYTGDREHPMYSEGRGRQERLPNGNTLITDSGQGHLVEVSPAGEMVWEFVNPIRETYDGKSYIPIVSGGYRFAAEDLPFLNP